jgi:hypothetical protein
MPAMPNAATTRIRKEAWLRDRRSGRRYPLQAEVEYKLIRQRKVLESGNGATVNVSSSGVLFEAGRPLAPGLQIELSIAWPALLDDLHPLKLLVSGRTVRSHSGYTAVRILGYDFHIRGRLPVSMVAAAG